MFVRIYFCLLLMGAGLCGCSSAQKTQVTRCQQEKEQLLETIRSQRSLVDDLKSKNESLATRLDEAEKEIARGPAPRKFSLLDPAEAKLATQPATTPAGASGAPATVPAAEPAEKLSWKPSRPATATTTGESDQPATAAAVNGVQKR
jgi:hypothetical protein